MDAVVCDAVASVEGNVVVDSVSFQRESFFARVLEISITSQILNIALIFQALQASFSASTITDAATDKRSTDITLRISLFDLIWECCKYGLLLYLSGARLWQVLSLIH
jgi:hypothetical protein